MEDLKGKRVLVLGMGLRTTPPLVKVLDQLGAKIIINDKKKTEDLLLQIDALKGIHYHLHTGDHQVPLQQIDLIIVNPAVPPNNPLLLEAKRGGIPYYGELELAYQLLKAPIIAITGTNGKTTTTYLVGEILKRGKKRVEVGGNIGRALIGLVDKLQKDDLLVAEVSSFQLSTIKDFSPKLGVILNISPDHLDYHSSYRDYIAAKERIFLNMGPNDMALLNGDQPLLCSLGEKLPGTTYYFSLKGQVSQGAYVHGERIMLNLKGGKGEDFICIKDLSPWSTYNLENVLASFVVASLYGIGIGEIKEVLSSFQGLEHRLEEVATIRGVTYFNNSKATNPMATLRDLNLFYPPLIIIMGGQKRGIDLSPLFEPLMEKALLVILLGETAQELEDGLRERGYHAIERVKDLQQAVQVASCSAKEGTFVILSPASPSWDMFNSYEERGEIFKGAVNRLKGVDS